MIIPKSSSDLPKMYQEMDAEHKEQMLSALALMTGQMFLMIADEIEKNFKDKSVKEICESLREEVRRPDGEKIGDVVTTMHNYMMSRQIA